MIRVTTEPIYDDFFNMCADARQSIKLCTPFIKKQIVDEIINAADKKKLQMQLITNINLQSFHRGVSDLNAIERLMSYNGVFNCTTLHAKVYIFDDERCIITSANLTTSGLRNNLECSVFIDDPKLVASAVEDYNKIINDEAVGKITQESVKHIGRILIGIPPVKERIYPHLDLAPTYDSDINPIVKILSGWKKSVFVLVNSLEEDTFTTHEVKIISEQLKQLYTKNHNREAKVRQVLQQLRDLGLIGFTSPGNYRRLWKKGFIVENLKDKNGQ